MISKGKKSQEVLLCGDHISSMCFGRGFDTQQIKVRLPVGHLYILKWNVIDGILVKRFAKKIESTANALKPDWSVSVLAVLFNEYSLE